MKFSSLDHAFTHIESFTNLEKTQQYTVRTYRLDRMFSILDHFDHPERSYPVIHVAGSKGKGSTCAFLAKGLKALGYKTGLYASPHVSTYMERFTLAGTFFPPEEVLSTIESMFAHLEGFTFAKERGLETPTTFELLTLLAFLLFKRSSCDYAVLETGLGGRLDATNVVSPVLTAITPIELEHTQILGSTIREIAREKGGIIKEGVPVVISAQHSDAKKELRSIAQQRGSKACFLTDHLSRSTSHSSPGVNHLQLYWSDDSYDEFDLRMLGNFQGENCALALLMLSLLGCIADQQHRKQAIAGMSSAYLPARMELIEGSPPVIIDGAHTGKSVDRLIHSYREMYPKGGVVIFGAVTGKDHTQMAESVIRTFDRIVISTPGTFKPSNPLELYELFTHIAHTLVSEGLLEAPPIIILEKDPRSALLRARGMLFAGEAILCAGSFYMASEIRNCILQETETCTK